MKELTFNGNRPVRRAAFESGVVIECRGYGRSAWRRKVAMVTRYEGKATFRRSALNWR